MKERATASFGGIRDGTRRARTNVGGLHRCAETTADASDGLGEVTVTNPADGVLLSLTSGEPPAKLLLIKHTVSPATSLR
jgi:hypothetical protein